MNDALALALTYYAEMLTVFPILKLLGAIVLGSALAALYQEWSERMRPEPQPAA